MIERSSTRSGAYNLVRQITSEAETAESKQAVDSLERNFDLALDNTRLCPAWSSATESMVKSMLRDKFHAVLEDVRVWLAEREYLVYISNENGDLIALSGHDSYFEAIEEAKVVSFTPGKPQVVLVGRHIKPDIDPDDACWIKMAIVSDGVVVHGIVP